MLRISVLKRRADFTLQAAFAAPTPGVTALFGRSGSGKTTLVDIISGLLPRMKVKSGWVKRSSPTPSRQ